MNLDNFKVTAAATDITDLVQGVTISENIGGLLKGNIQILDGQNWFDRVIGAEDKLMPLLLEFSVSEQYNSILFMIDGINQMKILKNEKEYTIHLITLEEMNLRLNDVNHVYSGNSHQILQKIYEDNVGEGSKLIINSLSQTKGKYIVPNIPAIEAIAQVRDVSVDSHRSGFFFYQRLWDGGMCRFGSLWGMSRKFHLDGSGNSFKIRNVIKSLEDMKEGVDQGTASEFELEEYRMNHTDKLGRGIYGHKMHHLELDESKITKNEALPDGTAVVSTRHKISSKLYDVLTESRGPHGEPVQYQQKSLFADIDSPNTEAANNLKRKVFNNTINVSGMVPSPWLGCGTSILLELGGGKLSRSISDGPYIIAQIHHKFEPKDGTGAVDYLQDVKLLREYA